METKEIMVNFGKNDFIMYERLFPLLLERYYNNRNLKKVIDATDVKELTPFTSINDVSGRRGMHVYYSMPLERILEQIKNEYRIVDIKAFIKWHACMSVPEIANKNYGSICSRNRQFIKIEKGFYYLDYLIRKIKEHLSGKIELLDFTNPIKEEDAKVIKSKTIWLGETHYYINELIVRELHAAYPDEIEDMYSEINVKYDDVYSGYYGYFDEVSSWN